MILEKQAQALVLQEGEETQESIGMSLDLDSAQILMQMLSKNLYSDAIGSAVRECASNALDSHRRAGTKDPIIVSFGINNSNNYEFSVEDFGIGLDADDVKNIISKYGKSTKRNSANELGMMGLGFKAPLAYSSSFYFVARKNGVERKYMMYEGEEVNSIDLLYETPTEERNGVKVIIPVQSRDKFSFIEKIRQQLAYFEDVFFNMNDFNNNFVIHRHEHFQFSELASDSQLHICLDNVYYPIDFNKINISPIHFPVALRFGLSDGIFPTPNRESIRYTQEVKTVILDKITKVADFFVQKYNESISETEDVLKIFEFYGSDERKITFGKSSWDIHPLSKLSNLKLKKPVYKHCDKFDFLKLYRLKDNLYSQYQIQHSISGGRLYTEKDNRWSNNLQWQHVHSTWSKQIIYSFSDKISGMKKDYLRYLHGRRDSVKIVKKNRPFFLGKLKNVGNGHFDNYINIIRLDNYPKSEWRSIIVEFQKVLAQLEQNFINLDKLVVPDSFIQMKKKERASKKVVAPKVKRNKLAGEIAVKEVIALERTVYGKTSKLSPAIIDLSKAHKKPYLTVYGKQEDASLMDNWFTVFPKTVKFVVVSERELKLLKDIKIRNWIKMEDFVKGEHIVFRRAATAYLIKQLISKHSSAFLHVEALSKISTDLSNKLSELKHYSANNYLAGDSRLYEEIDRIAKEANMFDNSIYSTYIEMEKFLNENVYINNLLKHVSRYEGINHEMKDMLCDLMKYHRRRLNWQNYKVVLNEEIIEVPTEETINDLTVA